MSAAAFPAPRATKAPEALVAPAVKMTLVQFLRLAHELFGRYFPEQVVQMAGKDGDNYTDQVQNVLVSAGWKLTGFHSLVLTNTSGMVLASVRRANPLFEKTGNWTGGFLYCSAFPKGDKESRDAIERRMYNPDEERIQQYRRVMPGIEVASISINTLKVMTWHRTDADKRSDDFQDWTRIFERVFDLLDFSESWGNGEQMFDAIYDPCWQWTTLTAEEIKAKLQVIADTAETEEEVKRRIRAELNYPFEEFRVFEMKESLFRKKRTFFVEIRNPLGHSHRLTVNAIN